MSPPDQHAVEDAARLAQEKGVAAVGMAREQAGALIAERPELAVAGAFVGGLVLAKLLRRLGT
jgi:electron transfer flavoprotein alpha/beta subunit